jgi:hypothetical protein
MKRSQSRKDAPASPAFQDCVALHPGYGLLRLPDERAAVSMRADPEPNEVVRGFDSERDSVDQREPT